MLGDLAAVVSGSKLADWTASLDDDNADNSLPAQVELAICWAANRGYHVDVALEWWGRSVPDLLIDEVAPGLDVVVDITCTGDVKSENKALRPVAAKILDAIRDRNPRKARGTQIVFLPDRGYSRGRYINRLRVPDGNLSSESVERIQEWADSPDTRATINVGDLAAQLQFFEQGIRGRQFRSNLVSGWETPNGNAIYRALRDKRDQLRNEQFEGIRGVILVDLGSKSLSRSTLRTWEPLYEYEDVISQFFADKSDGLDFVLVLTSRDQPKSISIFGGHLGMVPNWHAQFYGRVDLPEVQKACDKIVAALPSPKATSHRVGEMLRSGSKSKSIADRHSRLPTVIESGYMKPLTVKISAKSLLDFLSGQIDEATFRSMVNLSDVIGKSAASGGEIADAQFRSGGIDEDDDYVCLTIESGLAVPPSGNKVIVG